MRTSEVTASLVRHLEDRKVPTLVLGELALDGDWGSAGRLDVVALTFGSRRTTTIDGFEVKVSRSDFAKGVDSGQLQKYRRAVDRLTVAVPNGLVRKEEVPPGIGLLTVSDGGRWQTVVRPDPGQREDTGQLVRILRRLYDERATARRQSDDSHLARALRIVRMFDHARDLHRAEALYGYWLNEAVRDRIRKLSSAEARVADQLQQAEWQAQRIIREAEAKVAAVADLAATADVLRAALDMVAEVTSPHPVRRGGRPLPLLPDEAQPVLDALRAARQSALDRHRQPEQTNT